LREANQFFSSDGHVIGYGSAGQIWSFVSKFVMLDRFAKAMGLTEFARGLPFPKKTISSDYVGTASKVGIYLTNILRYN
jgi:hypothetical protein